ncbi:sterol desaturase family protein [Actibacterium sp. 188UL27-1]|uniref:sterol desaturase family protein n=1 Tax=Actibacterium sp. 188UL27-1 TaxID=2786961 RepID=UPI00195639F8|nr:sterol desaturase family protein [Actibacterium sp. 188UL27-1]MBM7066379.1 sterol desaturase family protein [Actibacterium sp. 188UL27-1]
MRDDAFGTRDSRGYWKPHKAIGYPPVFEWPFRMRRFVAWLPSYFAPWNLFYAALAAAFWFWLTPPIEDLRTLRPDWIGWLFLRNAALVAVFYGAWHVRMYILRAQGTAFKFNANWPDQSHKTFLFGRQTPDNMVWTFASAVPIWTAYEVLILWAFANGHVPWLAWSENPVWFVALLVLIPMIRDIHFYAIHRLIHVEPLYRWIHSLHHRNINPGPWSGLSMHPAEHVLYFSGALLHLVLPSHPVHAVFHLLHAGLSPAQGHVGFDRVVMGADRAMNTHSYAHYLHHRYFHCNYADGVVPLDDWMGTFHDGTDAAQAKMMARIRHGGAG